MAAATSLQDLNSFRAGMSPADTRKWFSSKLNRSPEHSDVYPVGTELYHRGDYQKCIQALELYVSLPGHQPPGVHLLGYAYYMAGRLEEALPLFKQAVKQDTSFESDWQLIIEIELELMARDELKRMKKKKLEHI